MAMHICIIHEADKETFEAAHNAVMAKMGDSTGVYHYGTQFSYTQDGQYLAFITYRAFDGDIRESLEVLIKRQQEKAARFREQFPQWHDKDGRYIPGSERHAMAH